MKKSTKVVTMKNILIFLFVLSISVHAQYCGLIGYYLFGQDKGSGSIGTYLGLISSNPYLTESIMNEYGSYGSSYSSNSIFNQYSRFGGDYGLYSPFNDYSINPPLILDFNSVTGEFFKVGVLSQNSFAMGGTVYDPNVLIATLASGTCVDNYIPPVATLPDLVIDSIQAFYNDTEDSLIVYFIGENNGEASTVYSFNVAIALNGKILVSDRVNLIDAYYYRSFMYIFPIDQDTTFIDISIDDSNEIIEQNEYNNISGVSYLTPLSTGVIPFNTPKSRAPIISTEFNGKFDIRGRKIKHGQGGISIQGNRIFLKR